MKRVFIDMDNVLVDFQSGLDQVSEEVKAEYAGRLDEIPGLFAKMKPMEGAIEAVHELQKHYDLFILSTAPGHSGTDPLCPRYSQSYSLYILVLC